MIPGDFPPARRRVPAARKAVRVIARKNLRPAETLRRTHDSTPSHGNSPRPARQHSRTRQPSAADTATLRDQHGNPPEPGNPPRPGPSQPATAGPAPLAGEQRRDGAAAATAA